MSWKSIDLDELSRESAAVSYVPDVQDDPVKLRLLSIKGVEGVGEGGPDEIVVFLRHPHVEVPHEIEGRKVVARVTGPIVAYDAEG